MCSAVRVRHRAAPGEDVEPLGGAARVWRVPTALAARPAAARRAPALHAPEHRPGEIVRVSAVDVASRALVVELLPREVAEGHRGELALLFHLHLLGADGLRSGRGIGARVSVRTRSRAEARTHRELAFVPRDVSGADGDGRGARAPWRRERGWRACRGRPPGRARAGSARRRRGRSSVALRGCAPAPRPLSAFPQRSIRSRFFVRGAADRPKPCSTGLVSPQTRRR